MRSGLLALCAAGIVSAGWVWASSLLHHRQSPPPLLSLQPAQLLADGYGTTNLSIEGASEEAPRISLDNPHGATIESITGSTGQWQARIRAGVEPGRLRLLVESPGHPPATAELNLLLDARDSGEDGTPDFLRLDGDRDRLEFRRWFTFLAEAQYFQSNPGRPSEIKDCAALIRYAYREALRAHDGAWADSIALPVIPAFDSVEKYHYPYTPLRAALFRARPGPFDSSDMANGAFLQFADARTLWRFNTHFLSRNLARALPGDLLFFRQQTDHVTFHSMIYLGGSQLRKDAGRYIVYHTGSQGTNPGEIRRLTVEELLRFPQPEWRPLPDNPNFLGVARWNILRNAEEEARER
jgi:uncharacterized protein